MRVNMDSSIVSDPRFKIVAKSLGVTWHDLIGRCFMVWLTCYERRSKRLSKREANAQAELDNYAQAMIEAQLADAIGDDEISFHGVEERIKFLTEQQKRGRRGGRASQKGRKNKAKTDQKQLQANAQANASNNSSERLWAPEANAQAYSPALTPAPALNTEPPYPPENDLPSDLTPGMNTARNPIDLAQLFHNRQKGRKTQLAELVSMFEGHVQAGWEIEDLRLAVLSATRNPNQSPGMFTVWLEKDWRDNKPQRCLTDEELEHGTYDPNSGFTKWTQPCRRPSCQRPECVAARKQREENADHSF